VTSEGEGGAEPTTPPASAPPAEEGEEASECDALPVQRDGTINRAGQAQAQPNGGAYRARAGTHTACLDAPDGADFDLVLQKANNRGQFRTVAQSTGTGDKTLSFDGRSGTYRYVVVATSGTGAYSLGFNVQ
jgi:streptogrisin C